MSEIQTRSRKRYRKGSTLDSGDITGDQFAEWLTGVYLENYAHKIADYCKAHKTCVTCQFFNGTCRLNRFPSDWDMKKF